jgi:hypothetical protein
MGFIALFAVKDLKKQAIANQVGGEDLCITKNFNSLIE